MVSFVGTIGGTFLAKCSRKYTGVAATHLGQPVVTGCSKVQSLRFIIVEKVSLNVQQRFGSISLLHFRAIKARRSLVRFLVGVVK